MVVADADVEAYLDRVLARGVERHCLRPFKWVIRRDPMRDSGVRRSPLRSVPDLKPGAGKLLVVLDHHGCGNESEGPEAIEAELVDRFQRAGFARGDARCLVLDPELEEVLVPVWDRAAELMATKRKQSPPPPAQVLAALRRGRTGPGVNTRDWDATLARQPKECFLTLLRLIGLRHQTALYDEIAREVSLPSMKRGRTGSRLGELLVQWFGGSHQDP